MIAAQKAQPSLANLLLPLILAWRQLRAELTRFLSALAGVMFAAVLVFMQLGFQAALFDSATRMFTAIKAELFLINPLTIASFRPEPLPRARAWQALAIPEIEETVPVYLAQATWRNPQNGTRRAIQVIGFDVEGGAVNVAGLETVAPALRRMDTIAFDRWSRPEFGDVATIFEQTGPFPVQVGFRMVDVVGLVTIGSSFGADGNLVTSELNFRRIISDRKASNTDLVAIRLKKGEDPDLVQKKLREILPADVMVLNHQELVAHERAYWEDATPIGFIFTFGSIMGLVVGMVIVYQILFSDVANHIREYATLKAIGYSNGYLARVVMGAALILAVLGFVPGAILSVWLYSVVADATLLPLQMTFGRAITVFALIFSMCTVAGLLAVRKLRDASPADMF